MHERENGVWAETVKDAGGSEVAGPKFFNLQRLHIYGLLRLPEDLSSNPRTHSGRREST